MESKWDPPPRKAHVLDARSGYDRVAEAYDGSPWRRFWKRNEYPIVQKIFLRLFQTYNFKSAIDIGSGTGFYSRYIEKYVPTVVGVDISSEMLRIAQRNSRSSVVHSDFLEFQSHSKFNFALAARTLSHIKNVDLFWTSMDAITDDGASVILTDIHPRHNYYKTRFDVGSEMVEIETYKHEMRVIFDSILNRMSDQILYKEFDFRSLKDKWISVEFRSIIGAIDPIFYILVFRKNDRIDDGIYRYMRNTLKFSSVTDG